MKTPLEPPWGGPGVGTWSCAGPPCPVSSSGGPTPDLRPYSVSTLRRTPSTTSKEVPRRPNDATRWRSPSSRSRPHLPRSPDDPLRRGRALPVPSRSISFESRETSTLVPKGGRSQPQSSTVVRGQRKTPRVWDQIVCLEIDVLPTRTVVRVGRSEARLKPRKLEIKIRLSSSKGTNFYRRYVS